MIVLGNTEEKKQQLIKEYVKSNNIKSVIVFSPLKFFMDLPDLGDVPIRQVEYNDVIMYRTFYPLLSEIGNDHLLIINEFLRVPQRRKDLTNNCLRHYLNQAGHQIIFEYFPMIEDKNDFMVLFDFDTKSKYIDQKFSYELLTEIDLRITKRLISIEAVLVDAPVNADELYSKQKDKLFDNLGNKSPDTIPRQLHVYSGNWKKPYIDKDKQYVARNARFKKPNVTTYADVNINHNYILLDFQHRRLDMNDFFRLTQQPSYTYISVDTSIDRFYLNSFNDWMKELEEFYGKASLYCGNS